jgi:hypothetical protein
VTIAKARKNTVVLVLLIALAVNLVLFVLFWGWLRRGSSEVADWAYRVRGEFVEYVVPRRDGLSKREEQLFAETLALEAYIIETLPLWSRAAEKALLGGAVMNILCLVSIWIFFRNGTRES